MLWMRGGRAALSLADRALDRGQIVQINFPAVSAELRFVGAVAAGEYARPLPCRVRKLSAGCGMQLQQYSRRASFLAVRCTNLWTRAPAAQPAADAVGQFADGRHHINDVCRQFRQSDNGGA